MNKIKGLKKVCKNAKSFRSKILYLLDKISFFLYFLVFGDKDIGDSLEPFSEAEKVLLFSPHQDDETLGCGGLLLASRDNASVQTIYITNGKGPKSLRNEKDRLTESKIRILEAERVCDVLQINKPINLDFDGIKIGAYDDLLIKKLSEQIALFKPTVIMTPFLTDANPEHVWLTKNIARIDNGLYKDVKIIFYRVHGQIPKKFQNAYFGLTKNLHQEKENVLNIFKTQSLDNKLVKSKYLLYSKIFPNYLRNKFKSVERYVVTDFEKFRNLDFKYGDDKSLKNLKSLNYSPFSFRCYLMNKLIFKRSSFVKFGPNCIE